MEALTPCPIPRPFGGAGPRPRVALVRGVSEGSFLERYRRGAEEMADDLGIELVTWDARGDPGALPDLVRAAARGGAQALVVDHGQGERLRSAVEEVLAQGVRVVAFDTAIDHPEVPEVEQDDFLIGHVICTRLAQDTAGRAAVIHVTADGFAPLARRERAWEAHRWRHPGLREVARIEANAANAAADAEARVGQALRAHPETTAILALWDEFAEGAVRAVERAGLRGKVRVYSVDVADRDIRRMREPGSPWVATAATDARAIGRLAVRAAAALLAGAPVERHLLLEPRLVTRELLVEQGITGMEALVQALPSLGESRLVWPAWMEALLISRGRILPASRLSPDQLVGQLRRALGSLEARNRELQATAGDLQRARDELQRHAQERSSRLVHAEAKLAQSSRYLEKIVDAVADPVFVKDRQHRLVLVNDALSRLLGRDRADILGRTDYDFLPKAEVDVFWEKDELVFTTGEENVNEEQLTSADGETHVIVTKKTLYADERGDIFIVGIIRDVTEARRLEERLRQSQKMETVGLLAGGVAHDFNNLLTPILGYAPLLLEAMPAEHPDREMVTAIQDAAGRAKDLTRRLLTFSRKQVIEPRVLDLRELVRGAERMLRRTIRESVQIEVALPDQLGKVRADPGQLEQVLLNLAINAQDAMPEGGRLQIEARDVGPGDALAGADQPPGEGAWVLLRVSDTGAGMDPRTLEHVFEPFFTTKELGRGTGLGLSTVYGIVEQHGGSITVQSARGEGTVFRVHLPRVAEEPVPAAPPACARAAGRGTEVVLVVEDDPIVRSLVSRLLRGFGYQVRTAEGGEECLARMGDGATPVDLLLTDVVMPRMNGRELYERLRERRPGLKVLFMSGYASDVIGRHGVEDDGDAVGFLQKPFTAADLAARVRQAIDGG
ncbi:substrate-binding domain-containing protein [Anaeromyxobacter paludicola]|uniref:histidine kinase n=1 Tax=Anaeromyxobacter paludicola TaxID=2918171 RepID=A0ABM7XCD1_9BACT|nr:substrate-binding domain-containing protein [Anaeromyxobacter paludicola]BDG09525.1 hypothetical protein AMPC_26380 [Anaeromyxobacter paludicola]